MPCVLITSVESPFNYNHSMFFRTIIFLFFHHLFVRSIAGYTIIIVFSFIALEFQVGASVIFTLYLHVICHKAIGDMHFVLFTAWSGLMNNE